MQENYLFITLPFICTKCVHHFYIVRIDFLECAVNNENGNDDGNDYPIAIDEEIFGPKITMILAQVPLLAWRLGRRDMDQVRGREVVSTKGK